MNKSLKNLFLAAAMLLPSVAVCAQQPSQQPVQAAQTANDLDAKYATDLLAVGTDAPEISLKAIDGKPFALSSLRGKYVVIDFWASWCPDCRKDAPAIVAMHEKFAGRGVEFVGVSFDTKAESWKSGVEKLGIKYTQVSDLKNMRESDVAKAYHIKWIPTVYVVNPEGKVVLATVMSEKVAAYLNSVSPDCAE